MSPCGKFFVAPPCCVPGAAASAVAGRVARKAPAVLSGRARAQALRPQQLAVFFRNNHFSVLLAHGGALMTLVTDQGYLHEPVRAVPRPPVEKAGHLSGAWGVCAN